MPCCRACGKINMGGQWHMFHDYGPFKVNGLMCERCASVVLAIPADEAQ